MEMLYFVCFFLGANQMVYNIISEALKEDIEPGKKYTKEEVL